MSAASVVVSVYNKIDYLKLVLAGLSRQSFRDFEIIIADDGSSDDFVKSVEALSVESAYPLIHLWHEDHGFRKNKILNKAITAANSDYIIFIDGDCVPHPEFVNEHYMHREKNVCLTGRRVNLSKKMTGMLTPENVAGGLLEKKKMLLYYDGIFGESYDVEKGFYFKNKFLRKYFNNKKRGILGCNFSIHKKDFIAVNGFDERYEAPSIGEDSDVQFRLELKGAEIKSLNNIAVQYHLYHKLQERPQKNIDLFEDVKRKGLSFTPFGIIKK